MRQVEVPAERLDRWLANFAERHGSYALGAQTPDSLTLRSLEGAVATLRVPFPPLVASADQDPFTALRGHLTRNRVVRVLLVRRGSHAVGVFAGTTLLSSKVGTAYVQGRAKAGGWSQQRFARRRARQATESYAEAAVIAAQVLAPRAPELDALVTGGDRPALAEVLRDPRLATLRPLVQDRVLDVPDPRLRVLAETPASFRGLLIELNDRA